MSGHDDLRDALGGVPIEVDDLEADDAGELARLITDARRRQTDDLRRAIDGGLDHIPRLLRGPVKRILF